MNRADKLKVKTLFHQLVTQLNAVHEGVRWVIPTPAGNYRFNLCDGIAAPFQREEPWIYGAFDDARRAGELFRANPYSGKLNFHDVRPQTFNARVASIIREFAVASDTEMPGACAIHLARDLQSQLNFDERSAPVLCLKTRHGVVPCRHDPGT